MDRTKLYQIVVIGGGFAGLRTALELDKRRARIGKCEITIVDRVCEHVYTPLLYEVCAGELESCGTAPVKALRSGVAFSLPVYVSRVRRGRIRFVHGVVEGIDTEKKVVSVNGARLLPYNALVVAPGVTTNTFGIPGVEACALKLKTLGGSIAVRERLCALVAEVMAGKKDRMQVVVCGAGATGTEFAAELAHWFRVIERAQAWNPGTARVVLVDAGPTLLSAFSARVQKRAATRLAELGVEIRLGTSVEKMEVGTVCLVKKTKEGNVLSSEQVASDISVWTAGIKPHDAVSTWNLTTDAKGSIVVDATFAVKDRLDVYALGDAAALFHPKTNARVPALAQAAIKESAIVAENLVRRLERKLPVNWTPPEKWISVIPLGGAFALADLGSVVISGKLGYAIRRLVDLIYFFSILPPRTAWKIWRKGMEEFGKNDVRATIPGI